MYKGYCAHSMRGGRFICALLAYTHVASLAGLFLHFLGWSLISDYSRRCRPLHIASGSLIDCSGRRCRPLVHAMPQVLGFHSIQILVLTSSDKLQSIQTTILGVASHVVDLVPIFVIPLPICLPDEILALILVKGHLLLRAERPPHNPHELDILWPAGHIAQEVVSTTLSPVSERMPLAPCPISFPLPKPYISAALLESTIMIDVALGVFHIKGNAKR